MKGTRTSTTDEHWMGRAAALARRGEGRTSPNPLVGAVLVNEGRVVGAGFHARAGGPHAEIVALKAAGPAARGADLYVTLEPCAHHGRTPPCADALVAAGVRRVVAGVQDPNPLVDGRGFARLAVAGVEIRVGVLAPLCQRLIEPYAVAMAAGRPFVHLKMAFSADGRIAPATGSSRWITGPAARRCAHRLRSRLDAVLVGITTVLMDDPALDVRLSGAPRAQPRAVVLDAGARTPPQARLLRPGSDGPPLILCAADAPRQRVAALAAAGARVVPVPEEPPGMLHIPSVLEALAHEGIQSILVEGGGQVAGSFLAAGVVDRATIFLAPVFLGSEATAAVAGLGRLDLLSAPRGRLVGIRRVGSDAVIELALGGR
ncbi:bifunctional diaminohydroxyphosphoribosylaminopyrimidine deaminase/5-amino-6-(5-phosphoribosylamino)uracil reductase RibD [Candidatus Fermentibacteria bacterium]|nr:bifunctional diaminohydroxyphosphoribosylaminopyrimidine deaminase/5-amino-6-(5-phosphoribosylamino)uracil reductase RibD [Candidatus Fermentibacteria bacterium]